MVTLVSVWQVDREIRLGPQEWRQLQEGYPGRVFLKKEKKKIIFVSTEGSPLGRRP